MTELPQTRKDAGPESLAAFPVGATPTTLAFLGRLREIARECGYAIAVHGSTVRDLDLIATPWTPEAVSAQQLVDVLCERVPLHARAETDYGLGSEGWYVEPNPEMKPWGRLAWALAGCPAPHHYIDLSVAPRAGEAVPAFIAQGYREAERKAIKLAAEGAANKYTRALAKEQK